MQPLLITIHLIITLLLIGVVMIQKSEGGALGIGGGSGGGGNIFSARGAGSALTRATAILAALFFASSIALAILATRGTGSGSAFDGIAPSQTAPAEKKPDETLLPNLGGGSQPPATPAQPVTPPAQ
jgi:preprotein translocase subunit SecG